MQLLKSKLKKCCFRPVVDSVADLGDTVGLFTHCVTVTLGDGTIVKQEILPGIL